MHNRPTVAVFFLAVLVAGPVFAQQRPLTAETMWSLKRLGEPAISPDGRLAAVPVTHYDINENKGFTDLWLFSLPDGQARQLTSDAAPDTAPVFSPDGKRIAFVSKRDADTQNQIYVIPTDGGEARRVTNVPTGASLPKWFPDGRRIAFVTRVWPDLVRWEDQRKRLEDRESSNMTARVWERAPVAWWDHWLDEREPHLFVTDLEGGEPQAITRLSGYSLPRTDFNSFSYDISPDGTEVAFAADVDRSGTEPNLDVIVLPACGCKPARNVTADNLADDGSPRFSPDGRWLAFTQQRIRGF